MRKAFWIRQICIWLVMLCISISFIEVAEAGNERSRHAAGEEKFTEIKEQVLSSAQGLRSYKASNAYGEIAHALEDLRKIHTSVQQANYVDDVIEEVSDGLDRIALTYEKVANLAPSVRKYRRVEFSSLNAANGEALKTEQKLKGDIAKLKSENELLQRRLESVLDEIDSKMIGVSIQGNISIINSLEGQRVIWEKFHQVQDKLLESLELNGRKLDYFLHVLEVNSRVYHEAANVARLRKSAKIALNNLGSLSDIQNIIGDLQDSWLEVDDIVSEISSAEFSITIE